MSEDIKNPTPASQMWGYEEAFYELANLMDIPAQDKSPREVWESQMLPKLREALSPVSQIMGSEREYLGILNPFGGLWTTDTFNTENEAMNHLHRFWASTANADLTGYRVVRVKASVIYVGEIDRPTKEASDVR